MTTNSLSMQTARHQAKYLNKAMGPVKPKIQMANRRPALSSIDNKKAVVEIKGPKKVAIVKPAQVESVAPELPVQTESATVESLASAFSSQRLDVEDVDVNDGENPQLVSNYIKEIYNYLHELEKRDCLESDFLRGKIVTGRMRSILVDWLCQVASRFMLLQETFYLTVDIIDRYLQREHVIKAKLQLVGISAMYLACKYEEMYSPPITDFAYIADHAFTTAEIRKMEIHILKTLDFNLGRPLPLHFLRRISKAGEVDATTHTLAKYLMELAIWDYDTCHYFPSIIAASSLFLAIKLLYNSPWTPTLAYYSRYEEASLTVLSSKMAHLVIKSENQKLQAIRSKYSSSKFMKISCIPELKSETIVKIAALPS